MSKGAAATAGQRVSAALRMARAELLRNSSAIGNGRDDLCLHKAHPAVPHMNGAPEHEQTDAKKVYCMVYISCVLE